MADDNTWELLKENSAPLERGRDVSTLSTALGKLSAEETSKIERKRRKLEKLVSRSAEEIDSNEDELLPWLAYIKYLQDTYPSDTQEAFLLMERCTRNFVDDDRYKNDTRFLRVCIRYADQTSSPMDVFKYLHQRKVGQTTSVFWVAWAWLAEKKQDFALAEKIFQKAISKGAQPEKFLQQRFRHFQRRMSRHWLNKSTRGDDEVLNDGGDGVRGTLTGLSRSGASRNQRSRASNSRSLDENGNDRSRRVNETAARGSRGGFSLPSNASSSSRRNAPTSNNNAADPTNAGFNIFVEEDAAPRDVLDVSYNENHVHSKKLETEADRKKENEMKAEQWNLRGGLSGNDSSDSGPNPTHQVRERSGAQSFAIFVDDECVSDEDSSNVQQSISNQRNDDTNKRSLRQRYDDSMADKLVRDPLLYVKNPEKLHEQDEAKHNEPNEKHSSKSIKLKGGSTKASISTKPPLKDSSDSRQWGFNKKLVAKGPDGHECSFEMGRTAAKSYTLMDNSSNFNSLVKIVQVEVGLKRTMSDSAMSIAGTDESVEMGDVTNECSLQEEEPDDRGEGVFPRKVLFSDRINCSIASQRTNLSTVSSNVNESIAVGGFVDPEDETINKKVAMKELSMMFASPSQFEASLKSDQSSSKPLISFHTRIRSGNQDSTHSAVDNPKNGAGLAGDTEDNGTATFSIINGLMQDDDDGSESGENAAVSSRGPRTLGKRMAFQSMAKQSLHEEYDSDHEETHPVPKTFTPFSVYTDDNEEEEGVQTASFSDIGEAMRDQRRITNAKPFSVYTDNDQGETATFSDIRDIMYERRGESNNKGASFSVYCDGHGDGGDTATFSDVGEAMCALNVEEEEDDDKTEEKPSGLFAIYQDEEHEESHAGTIVSEVAFGNISRIVPEDIALMAEDDDLASKDDVVDSPTISDILGPKSQLRNQHSYGEIHEKNLEAAFAEVTRADNENVFSLDKNLMPRKLAKRKISSGTRASVGGIDLVVENDLGHGAHGDVYFCKSTDDDEEHFALKIQSPTYNLLHEYHILSTLISRLPGAALNASMSFDTSANESKSFPKPRSLTIYSDGALLEMSAASPTGATLLDTVNAYKTSESRGGTMPELLAVFYTARMLKVLEELHWHGRILHCDVKPDNWALTGSDESPNSDVMLIDFGRAIDLLDANPSSPLDAQFLGDSSTMAEGMACVAIQENRSWGLDADTYGLCASAYVLLFGAHMEVCKDSATARWKPTKPFRRYWNKKLWFDLFDTTLNSNVKGSSRSSGSHPNSLRRIRKSFEEYLDGGNRRNELSTLLRQQARMLR